MRCKSHLRRSFAGFALLVCVLAAGCSDSDSTTPPVDCLVGDLEGNWCWTDPCDPPDRPAAPAELEIAGGGNLTYSVAVASQPGVCINETTGTWSYNQDTGVITFTYTTTNRSPEGPPLSPASPSPWSRSLVPVSAPAGMLTSIVLVLCIEP